MKFIHAAMLAALATVPAAQAAEKSVATIPVKVKGDKDVFGTKVETDGGLAVETMDGRASFHIEGRFQFDTLFFNGLYNDAKGGGWASDTKTRRMRLGVGGELDKDWEWLYVVDINNDTGKATLDTGQVTYKGFSYANVDVGRFKRPFLMDALTSSKWLWEAERSLAYDVVRSHVSDFSVMLSKGYDVGAKGKLSWYTSVVNEGVEDYGGGETATGKDQYQYYARVAYAPWTGKGDVLHFGASFGELNPAKGSTIDIVTRLGVSSADAITNSYTVDDDMEAGLEAGYQIGALTTQAEYIGRRLNLTAGDKADIQAGYVQVAYTLTGEPRAYKPYWARFDRVTPSGEHSFGAVELVSRYDILSMEKPAAATPKADVLTVGANWYFNTHLHLMLDYLAAHEKDFGTTKTHGNAVVTRLAFQF